MKVLRSGAVAVVMCDEAAVFVLSERECQRIEYLARAIPNEAIIEEIGALLHGVIEHRSVQYMVPLLTRRNSCPAFPAGSSCS